MYINHKKIPWNKLKVDTPVGKKIQGFFSSSNPRAPTLSVFPIV